ncbi:MAG: sigma-70 family RNA polymerase sigma factor [Planctomycetota bacterium]|nr:sigma-70 family RNA polymerase sigma factor [Planctomycetota bacterium]
MGSLRYSSAADSIDQYLSSLRHIPRLSADEERSLAIAWRERQCRDSRDRLITANLRLAISMVRRYLNRGIAFDELVAEANIGLVLGVDHFDPHAGVRFSTYAAYWIRHSIAEAFARASARPSLSRGERGDITTLRGAEAAFRATHGYLPSVGELAGALGWPIEKARTVQLLASARTQPLSLGDAGPAPHDTPAAEEAEGISDEQRRMISGLLDVLSADERRIVELRFGLDGPQARSIPVIASMLRVQPRVIRTRLEMAMAKLGRHASASRPRASGQRMTLRHRMDSVA